jgi:hypothetical protein
MAKPTNVISHWYQLIENFQASPLEFYDSVERAVAARAVPETRPYRVEHKEAGLASASREYLRMHRGTHAFDICAAPFGNGFFVSWWFTEPPLKLGFLYTLAFLVGVYVAATMAHYIGFSIGTSTGVFSLAVSLSNIFEFVGVPLLLWFLGYAMRQGNTEGESTVLAMPLIGWIYKHVFAPETLYAMDTALMFQAAVHSAVLEVVDGMTAAKGIRALSESQRKPILTTFAPAAA